MRIDSHAHGNVANLKSPSKFISACERAGIGGIVLIRWAGPEGGLFEAARKLGSFVIPVAFVDMDRAGSDDVHRLFDQGAKGIKFIRPNRSYSDDRYYHLYQAVKERDGVAVFHTGYLMHTPDYDPRHRTSMDQMRAGHLDRVLRWIPHLKVLMAHFGNPYWDECRTVMRNHPTVYADLSGGTAIYRSMLFWRETFAPNGELSEATLGKVCFGGETSYFSKDDSVNPEIEKYISFYDRLMREAKAPAALREKVNSGNILALFNHRIAKPKRKPAKNKRR